MNKNALDPTDFDSPAPSDGPCPECSGDLPPAVPEGRVLCDDLGIRIDREGTWYYHGSPVARKELVCLFASMLHRDEAGDFWLITPAEEGRIQVDDAPFMAVEVFPCGEGQKQVISLRTNVDEIITIDDDHPLRVDTNAETGEPSPYVVLRPGIEARLARPVFYELVELGLEVKVGEETVYGVWSSGSFFKLGTLDNGA